MPKLAENFVVSTDVFIEGKRGFPDTPTTQVGTPLWFDFLEHDIKSFRYELGNKSFTAVKERRNNSFFWYASKKIDGRLKRCYLGRSKNLTNLKLAEVANKLNQSNLSFGEELTDPERIVKLIKENKEQRQELQQTQQELSDLGAKLQKQTKELKSILKIIKNYQKRAKKTRDWTQFNRLLAEILITLEKQ